MGLGLNWGVHERLGLRLGGRESLLLLLWSLLWSLLLLLRWWLCEGRPLLLLLYQGLSMTPLMNQTVSLVHEVRVAGLEVVLSLSLSPNLLLQLLHIHTYTPPVLSSTSRHVQCHG